VEERHTLLTIQEQWVGEVSREQGAGVVLVLNFRDSLGTFVRPVGLLFTLKLEGRVGGFESVCLKSEV
jgi:hypothetical protein